jgi:hypothetical protein
LTNVRFAPDSIDFACFSFDGARLDPAQTADRRVSHTRLPPGCWTRLSRNTMLNSLFAVKGSSSAQRTPEAAAVVRVR